jgi:hypothetical protein
MFEAPMVLVTDTTDSQQVRKRRLHYYDMVKCTRYDGTSSQMVVVSCSPSYRKDGVQMAHYVLMTQGNIDQIAIAPTIGRYTKMVEKVLARITGETLHMKSKAVTRFRQGEVAGSASFALPTTPTTAIQNWDNTSPNFGKFYYLVDYDKPGTSLVR